MKNKKILTLLLVLTISILTFTGCGKNSTGDTESEGTTLSVEDTENVGLGSTAATDTTDSTKDAASDTADDVSGTAAGDTGKDEEDSVGDDMKEAADDAGDAAEDIADGAADAVDDVADGVGDAIDNLGGGSFDSYDEAKKYLLEKLQKDNASANYELRDETEDLTAYNSNDSGAEGYKFSVYETDGDEKIGIYYVDKDTGKIYRYMGKNSIEGY